MSETGTPALIRQLSLTNAVPRIAIRARRDPQLVEALVDAVSSDTACERLGAVKVLRIVSGSVPEMVYPHFDFFSNLMRHTNSILRWNAMLVIGNLAAVDEEQRIDAMIGQYLAPISGASLIDAANVMRGAVAIAGAKPHLADRIARSILQVEHATYQTPECRNVAIGHAIESLDRIFPMLAEKHPVQQFILRQTESTRPATRKKAQKFLRKWPLARCA